MKLLFTSYAKAPEYDNPGLWLKYLEAYTGILEALSKEHRVIDIERISFEGQCEKKGVHYYFINQKKKVARFPRRMHNLIKSLEPDVVFVNGISFPLQVMQLRLTLGNKVKIILLHRADKPFSGIKKYLQRLADRDIDGYLFVSSEFGEKWKENISTEKIYEVIQASSVFTPSDKTEAKKKLLIAGAPVFLWVGNLDGNKDPVTAVKAFMLFLQQQPFARLYMIYQSDKLLQELKALTGDIPAIQFIGKKDHHELQDWYNAADFFMLGSHYEGSGISLAEAMSCGCVPVVTDIISFRRMTGPGKCGLLYNPGDEPGLLRNLLLTRSLDVQKEKEKTLRQFAETLSFEAIAEKILNICNMLKAK